MTKALISARLKTVISANKYRGGDEMKTIAVKIDNELHKQLKIYAANENRTVTDIVVSLVKSELTSKKSNHSNFGE